MSHESDADWKRKQVHTGPINTKTKKGSHFVLLQQGILEDTCRSPKPMPMTPETFREGQENIFASLVQEQREVMVTDSRRMLKDEHKMEAREKRSSVG